MTQPSIWRGLQPPAGNTRRSTGFTLIEMMIAVAIVGILASIAIPSYVGYLERSNLAEAKSALMDAASQMERHYTSNYQYAAISLNVDLSDGNPYTVGTPQIFSSGADFLVSATGAGRVPDNCGTIWVDSLGQRGSGSTPESVSASASPDSGGCW